MVLHDNGGDSDSDSDSDLEDNVPLSRWLAQQTSDDSDDSEECECEEEEGGLETDLHANATVLASLQQEGRAKTAAHEFRIAMGTDQ